ncbi:MAG: hypothetical protein K0Q68_2304 [Moraxellaceae bacterium]|jgi:hypothetical protein|nr:hypothetical protein [Moraxellaceae bacterium]
MQKRITAILLAASLGAASSLALAEGAPAAPAAPMGPMGGKGEARPQAGGPGMEKGERRGMGPMAGKRMKQEKLESFTEESVRKMADGRVIKRQIEQKVGEGSFSRKEVVTNPEGKTMTRTMTATLNKDKKTWTRKVDVVEFDGSTWSRSQDVPAMHGPDGDDMGPAAHGPARPGKAERPKKAN